MFNKENLKSTLKTLNLSFFVENFSNFAEKSEKEQINHVCYLNELSQGEVEKRHQQKIQNLIKKSKIPRHKTINNFDLSRIPSLSSSLIQRLSQGDWFDKTENILIFGNPGTGKTHLCLALTREWCLKGRKVFYTMAGNLVQELLRAKQATQLDQYIKRLDNYEVLIIDDISYLSCDRQETDVLFHLLSARYEQRSVVITSNLAFSHWGQIFKDEMTTAAVIDRLVHHSSVLELNAESYRIATAKNKQGNNSKKEVYMES